MAAETIIKYVSAESNELNLSRNVLPDGSFFMTPNYCENDIEYVIVDTNAPDCIHVYSYKSDYDLVIEDDLSINLSDANFIGALTKYSPAFQKEICTDEGVITEMYLRYVGSAALHFEFEQLFKDCAENARSLPN
jgi:hypothetical protein